LWPPAPALVAAASAPTCKHTAASPRQDVPHARWHALKPAGKKPRKKKRPCRGVSR
jgi:hypothetical protein